MRAAIDSQPRSSGTTRCRAPSRSVTRRGDVHVSVGVHAADGSRSRRCHGGHAGPVRRRGGTGTHSPTVGQHRDGASSQAPTRSLPPAVRAQGVSRPAEQSLRGQPRGASRSFGSDRAGERRHPTSLPIFDRSPGRAAGCCSVHVFSRDVCPFELAPGDVRASTATGGRSAAQPAHCAAYHP